METCSAFTEKDETLISKNIEFTKIENVYNEKFREFLEQENILKQKEEELTQNCNVLEKENEILKQKCSAESEKCFQKENVVQEMKKEYDVMKNSHHRTKEHMKLKKSNQKNNKLQSYHASSYILEHIFNIKPDDNDSEKNKKGIGSEYYLVPPPLEKNILSMMMRRWQRLSIRKIEKVCKLVEIEKSEIDKFVGKASKKTFYNKPSYKKKNTKGGLGYKKKQNQNKRFEKIKLQKKMNFVHVTSSEEEKELRFNRQTNEEFYAQKKKQQAKDVLKKTCFKCQKVGHIGRKCPNMKPVNVEKEKKKSETVKHKSPKFEPKQIWKPKVDISMLKQIWKPNTSKFEPKPFWKLKIDLLKRNVQNDSRFYERNVSKGQIWVVKKQTSVNEKRKIDSTKNVEVKNEKVFFFKNDKDFPKLNDSYCIKIPKVKQAWVVWISNL
ncbi:putative transcription factor interactor and regulator CCHC(Zn) family [Helianthus anomalus]